MSNKTTLSRWTLFLLLLIMGGVRIVSAQLPDQTWKGFNETGDTLIFTVSGNSITTNEMVTLLDESRYNLNLTGKAVWLQKGIVQIIYNDKPREQGFVKYELDDNGNLNIKRSATKNFSRSVSLTLQKE